MSPSVIAALVFAVGFMIVMRTAVIVVPDGNAYIVERLGRYHATLPPGLHVILPFFDRVAHRYSIQPREEEITDQCVTRENVAVRVTSVLRARIANPERAAYASANAGDSVQTLVRTHQRKAIGERSWDDVRMYPRELEAAVMREAAEPARQMGVEILALDVTSVERVE